MKYTTTIFLCLTFFLYNIGNRIEAQSLEEENEKVFSTMDQSSFKGKVVLNKGILIGEFLAPF